MSTVISLSITPLRIDSFYIEQNTNNTVSAHDKNSILPVRYVQQQSICFANIASANVDHIDSQNDIDIFSKFMEEFKTMFSQLIQQNSMVINIIAALVNRIH